MSVSRSTMAALRELGHQVEHVHDLGLDRSTDAEILARAQDDQSIVVTFDLDFGDLLAANRDSLPSVIIVRLADQRPVSATPRILAGVERFGESLEQGALLIVEKSRFRLRRLPLE